MNLRERIRQPPSGITGELRAWLQDVAEVLNDTPQLSYFSGTTPNSALTGIAGDLAINVGSASTDTRLWIKGGSTSTIGTTNWVTLRTGPA